MFFWNISLNFDLVFFPQILNTKITKEKNLAYFIEVAIKIK